MNLDKSKILSFGKEIFIVGKWFQFEQMLIFITTQWRLLTHWRKKPFEIIVGKEENAGNQHFIFFPQCLLSYEWQLLHLE